MPQPTAAGLRTQYIDENNRLIEVILENQNLGRLHECVQYQLKLQQNLIYLATYADEHPGLTPLPPPRQPRQQRRPPPPS